MRNYYVKQTAQMQPFLGITNNKAPLITGISGFPTWKLIFKNYFYNKLIAIALRNHLNHVRNVFCANYLH